MNNPISIKASPEKNFFVNTLTRDIDLDDAILDLLDNCVDGIQRLVPANSTSEKPYAGYTAKLKFDGKSFILSDNCGGIPKETAVEYAFKFGRPKVITVELGIHSIGTYGIGMKRAIFKLGSRAKVTSQTPADRFYVDISPEWLDSESWDLSLVPTDRVNSEPNGTTISVQQLHPTIARRLGDSSFEADLIAKISRNFNFIIEKGFSIQVNDKDVRVRPVSLLWNSFESNKVNPFLYQGERDGVLIRLAVGFYRPLPTEEEEDEGLKGTRHTSEDAGWTIICNDRVVVRSDKTRLTGWGDFGVPSYHPQFVAISGVVFFESTDVRKLPINTIKRGVDASNDVFLYTRNLMVEGLKIFTDYTYKLKKQQVPTKEITASSLPVEPKAAMEAASTEKMWRTAARNKKNEFKYLPSLPELPTRKTDSTLLHFFRPKNEVQFVAENLLGNEDADAAEVGAACFDDVLRRLKR